MKTSATETSIDCYYNTVVGKYQTRFHNMISAFMLDQKEPMSRREIGKALGLETNQYSGRCNELIAAKVLVVVGEKRCSLSGKTVESLLHSVNANPQKQLFN